MKPADFPVGGDYDDIKRVFGDPGPVVGPDWKMSPDEDQRWRSQILDRVAVVLPAPVRQSGTAKAPKYLTRVYVHRLLSENVIAVFAELVLEGAWQHITDFAGSYCFRLQRGGTNPSLHSWAAALDFCADRYPLKAQPDPRDPFITKVVPVFEAHGWTWGGRWGRKDAMHFEATRRPR